MHRLLARVSTRPAWWRGAQSCPMGRNCWFLTTFQRLFPPSVHRPGARSRAASRTKSRTRSTPIQLSAERLEMKLVGQGAACQNRPSWPSRSRPSSDQVDAMKRLVNEFRDYARLPAAELQPLDLNALIADVLHLYGEENASVPVEARARPALSSHRRRCAAAAPGRAQPAAKRPGRHHAGTGRGQGNRALRSHLDPVERVLGAGAAGSFRQRHGLSCPTSCRRAFEPYVTTKATGHRLGFGGGEKDRRRAWRPHRSVQPHRKRRVARRASVAIICPRNRGGCLSHPPHNSCGLC